MQEDGVRCATFRIGAPFSQTFPILYTAYGLKTCASSRPKSRLSIQSINRPTNKDVLDYRVRYVGKNIW